MLKVNVYTNELDYDNRGDFIVCCDCEELMLVGIGDEKCVKCGSENLRWFNASKQEWTIEELKQAGFTVEEQVQINWNKIEVDTPVLVKDNNMEKWVEAYFADFVDARVYTFPNGLTSHSYQGIFMVGWDEAKLVESYLVRK